MSHKASNQKLKVFVRIRPFSQHEHERRSIVEVPNEHDIIIRQAQRRFSFERVFPIDSKQVDVYKSVVFPTISEVLCGYNCTVFAYGQTGTGKTYTMTGDEAPQQTSWSQDSNVGIIPRAVAQIFDELRAAQTDFAIKVSYLELYNEELIDLLSGSDENRNLNLKIYDDPLKKGSVVIHGLTEEVVRHKNEVYGLLQKGTDRRQTASTLMNSQSSRSHTVFTITVHMKEERTDGQDVIKVGKLNLVDLAGSENIGRSGAVDKRANEAGNINKSLLTLGRVITALVDRKPHVPYRESKLTRLLSDSLGGHTKTSFIATIAPTLCNIEETLSTLDYAMRARNITNKPEVNEKVAGSVLLKQYSEEIDRLRRELRATQSQKGIFMHPQDHQTLMSEYTANKQELTDKINEIKSLEEIKQKLELTLIEMNSMNVAKETQLQEVTKTLQEREEECEIKEFIINECKADEIRIAEQASEVVRVTERIDCDNDTLHSKLINSREIDALNIHNLNAFDSVFGDILTQANAYWTRALSDTSEMNAAIRQTLVKHREDFYATVTDAHTRFKAAHTANVQGLVAVAEIANNMLANNTKNLHAFNEQFTSNERVYSERLNERFHDAQALVDSLDLEQTLALNIINEYTAHLQTTVRASLDEMHARAQVDREKLEIITRKTAHVNETLENFHSEFVKFMAETRAAIDANQTEIYDWHAKRVASDKKLAVVYEAASDAKMDELKRMNVDRITQVQRMNVDKLNALSLAETHECARAGFIAQRDFANDYFTRAIGNVHEELDKLNVISGTVCHGIEETSEVFNGTLDAIQQSNNTALDAVEQHVDNSASTVQHFAGETRDYVKRNMTRFRDYIASKIKRNQPQGDTPARVQATFPRQFKLTSPNERLVKRFFERKQATDNTEEVEDRPKDVELTITPQQPNDSEPIDSSSDTQKFFSQVPKKTKKSDENTNGKRRLGSCNGKKLRRSLSLNSLRGKTTPNADDVKTSIPQRKTLKEKN